jgi:DNA mismatch repair protein MutS
VVEDALLRAKSENYLAAIVSQPSPPGAGAQPLPHSERGEAVRVSFGLALIDLSTGEFATTQIEGADAESKLFDELQRVQASELVLPPGLFNDDRFSARLKKSAPRLRSPSPLRECYGAADPARTLSGEDAGRLRL